MDTNVVDKKLADTRHQMTEVGEVVGELKSVTQRLEAVADRLIRLSGSEEQERHAG